MLHNGFELEYRVMNTVFENDKKKSHFHEIEMDNIF